MLRTFKGTLNEYISLHYWVKKQLGKPQECSKCGKTTPGRYDWANVSGEYRRDLSDWMRLCRSCHMTKDKRRTICDQGHLLIGYNLVVRKTGYRECRQCKNTVNASYRKRLSLARGKQ